MGQAINLQPLHYAAHTNALALPVAEAVLARHIAEPYGFVGRGTIASASEGQLDEGRFTGTVSGAVASADATYLVAPACDGGALILNTAAGELTEHHTLSGEARDTWRFVQAPAISTAADVILLGAFARTAQIAGALDAALSISVGYVNERKQFGRPLAKFQAVQQNLALFAGEAAAANCAAVGAAQALDMGQGDYAVAAAKLRANRAVGTGTAIAHQVHGAIGFTQEYHLHPLTRRLAVLRSSMKNRSSKLRPLRTWKASITSPKPCRTAISHSASRSNSPRLKPSQPSRSALLILVAPCFGAILR